jgi:hypothetical protein
MLAAIHGLTMLFALAVAIRIRTASGRVVGLVVVD